MLGQGGDTRTWKYYYQAHPLYNCHKKFLFQEDTKMYEVWYLVRILYTYYAKTKDSADLYRATL